MSRKITPWLLAASVFLTGATGIMSSDPAFAITSVDELTDVNSSHWAYDALADLVEKYDVLEGYPSHTFRGDRAPTRYEMAAALNSLLQAVGRDLARLGAEKANKSDLATLARLQEEFRAELAALSARTTALEGRAAAIEAKNAEQDTRLDLLEKTQVHGDVSFGFLADTSDHGFGSGANEMLDGITSIGRVRLGLQVPVVEDFDDSYLGEGDVIVRLVSGFGRTSPTGQIGSNPTFYGISGISDLAGAATSFNNGVRPSTGESIRGGGNLQQKVYVGEAYYKQHIKEGVPGLTKFFWDKEPTLDIYAGVLPWGGLFNRSPYKGDALNQFQNTSLTKNPGALVNFIVPTLAASWHQPINDHWSLDLTGATSSLDNSDFFTGWMITEEGSLNFDTYFLGEDYTWPGNVYAGGYHIIPSGNTSIRNIAGVVRNRDGESILFEDAGTDGINAFYVGWNQEWWRGIGTTVDYVLNETGGNNALFTSLQNGTGARDSFLGGSARAVGVQQALSAALTVPLTAIWPDATSRAKDAMGVGYAWIDPMERGDGDANATFDSTNEHVVEAFYRWAVNDSVTIVPSFQAIFNRFGISENDVYYAFGLRSNFIF